MDRVYGDETETGHTFLFTLNDTYVIDANVHGNDARWINHSCEPNCEAEHVEDEDEDPARDAIFIDALRDIAEGEELTCQLRHRARRSAYAADEETLGLPLRLEEMHGHDAASSASARRRTKARRKPGKKA